MVYILYIKAVHFRMAEFSTPVRGEIRDGGAIERPRGAGCPEVSLHTAVKGQFGLGTGRAMGKGS